MNSNSLFIKSVRISSELINYQTVRWLKKPFWMGIAKSKMFVLKEPKELPPDQRKEYYLLNNHYRARLNSILYFIKKENPKIKDQHFSSERDETGQVVLSSALEKKIAESFEVNDRWNAESARRREERKKIEMEKFTEEATQIMETEAEKRQKLQEAVEEIVRKEKELSKSFITPETLDEAIENCLNKVEHYDFAIDLDGNRYEGRESLQGHIRKEKVEQAA